MTMLQFIFACLVVYAIIYVNTIRVSRGLIKFFIKNLFDAFAGISIAIIILALFVYFDIIYSPSSQGEAL